MAGPWRTRYQPAPDQPELLLVSVTAHETAAEFSACIHTSEANGPSVIEERMTKDAMLSASRPSSLARHRQRVAWIQEREIRTEKHRRSAGTLRV